MWFQSDIIICFGLPDSLVSLSMWQFTHLHCDRELQSIIESWRKTQIFILIVCSAMWMHYCKSTSVTHHLLSRISAGFTTSPCLNTPALQHLSRAADRVAQQQHFCFTRPWYWILATFCSPPWTMTEVTADAPSDQPWCVGWMISCTRSEN